MALLPNNKNTTEYQIESKNISSEKPRSYLGMSGIGNECLRAQWYGWRWYTKQGIVARVKRIFERGHLEESSIIMDLISVGCEVYRIEEGEKIPMSGAVGEEQEEIIGYQRHCKGHPDGRISGVIEAPKTEHLLELKTMNDKNFQVLKVEGIKKGFPGYYSQIQKYMGELKLKRALFIATNKNDQARKYLRVKFDKAHFTKLVERERSIILSEKPPTKKWKADSYNCNFCNHFKTCHMEIKPNKTCRSCKDCDLLMNGRWGCGKTGKKLSVKKQLKACKEYSALL